MMNFQKNPKKMSFYNGNWMYEPGITPVFAESVADTSVDGDTLTLFTSQNPNANRRDLGGPMLTIKLTSPAPNIIGVELTHFRGGKPAYPNFELGGAPTAVEIADDAESVSYKSGELELKLKKHAGYMGWNMEFFGDGKKLTASGGRSAAYFYDDKTERGYTSQQLDIGVGECIYGLGERFGPFVKNGQDIDMWQADGGTGSEQAYKNVPFYMSNKGYGVFVDSPADIRFEVGTTKVERVMFSAESETLRYFVIYGAPPADILERYTLLTGRPALPPAWSFGLWLSTSFTTDYDEKTASSFIDGMAEREIPLSVFHFDCFWMKGNHWTDFEWDADMFPDPEGMLRRYHEKGLKICVWINPYIAQQSRLFDEAAEKGYLIKKEDGGVWQTDLWQSGMGVVDFTNPAACEWYAEHLTRLMRMGVDCFKTDFGERIPVRGVKYFDGSDPVRMHNYYTELYNKVVFTAIERERGVGEAVVFARSGTAGTQKYPLHWGGDNAGNYPSMAETLRAGLSLAVSGYGFWSHDIGGFEATAPADLYKRWCAFGLLSSHSRLHGSSSYRVPWSFDEQASDVLKRFVKLKNSMMPYIYEHAIEAHELGVPVLRPMVFEFADDPACAYLDRQYMLGKNLLVAPVFSADGTVDFYVPQGSWLSVLDGKRYEGGRWYRERFDYFSLPLLLRENAILPIGGCDDRPDYDYASGLTLKVNVADGGRASCEIPNVTGVRDALVTVERSGKVYTVSTTKPLEGLKLEIDGKLYDCNGLVTETTL